MGKVPALLVMLVASAGVVLCAMFFATVQLNGSSTTGVTVQSSVTSNDMPWHAKTTTTTTTTVARDTIEERSTTHPRRLRRDWSDHPPLSPFAQQIWNHQSNCSSPVLTFHVDDHYGLGSHLAQWSQGVCNAMEKHSRLRTYNPLWLWLDREQCSMETAEKSPLLCYFPKSEFLCDKDEASESIHQNITNPRFKNQWCDLLRQPKHARPNPNKQPPAVLEEFRAASTEYLFRAISPVVMQEAERQALLVFAETGGVAPDDLITVHMRWGDKFWEMDLAHEQEYVDAVSELLLAQMRDNRTANIYLATEDPRARDAFLNVTPSGWKVYMDRTMEETDSFRPSKGNRASHAAKNTQGRAGLVAMGSLLLAMEAKYFVLTTGSNWSRLINQLRTKVVDPRCGNCTRMIDLRPGFW